MITPELAEAIKATLDWCNELRKEQDKEPLTELPKGQRKNPHSCPCGAATGLRVQTWDYYSQMNNSGYCQHLGQVPLLVTKFIEAFDAGELPEYEL